MNNEKINIRLMTEDDLSSIKDALISDFDDFWTFDILKKELQNENTFYFVALLDDEIIGFIGILKIIDSADLMNIVVKKNMRKNGIGQLLLSYIINYSENNNIQQIMLEVNENNKSAIHLYQKNGFVEISKRKNYYNGKETAIIMQLAIINN